MKPQLQPNFSSWEEAAQALHKRISYYDKDTNKTTTGVLVGVELILNGDYVMNAYLKIQASPLQYKFSDCFLAV